ncbi:MAG: hypothetical protein H0X37_05745 [Herpetosiphonaceae bacterium]|nr:hypothetical protein [Herpetosiphonaceae bacterium]
MDSNTLSKKVMWAGIILILLTGLIHVIDAPSSFGDATYKGLLFVANALGALVSAVGIYRGSRSWGWGLGLLVAGGAFVMYIISRTVGLPGLEPDVWLEPLGIASLIVEALFVGLTLWAMARRTTTPVVQRNVSREGGV